MFWKEVQVALAHRYSLEHTRVVTNSDGGAEHTPEKFKEAFFQSRYPVWNKMNYYHVYQALNLALSPAKSETKTKLRQVLRARNQDDFRLWLDTYESNPGRTQNERSYIL